MKIVADDKIPFLKGVFEPYGEIVYLPGDEINSNLLVDADVLLTRSITQCNADLLKKTAVKFIVTATIGDDHIDKLYCMDHNIEWATAKGSNAGADQIRGVGIQSFLNGQPTVAVARCRIAACQINPEFRRS